MLREQTRKDESVNGIRRKLMQRVGKIEDVDEVAHARSITRVVVCAAFPRGRAPPGQRLEPGAEPRNRPWDKREGVARGRSNVVGRSFSIQYRPPAKATRQSWSLTTLWQSERLAGHPSMTCNRLLVRPGTGTRTTCQHNISDGFPFPARLQSQELLSERSPNTPSASKLSVRTERGNKSSKLPTPAPKRGGDGWPLGRIRIRTNATHRPGRAILPI
jgi:hypothetical protein